jgi:predicted extracellular nuclease
MTKKKNNSTLLSLTIVWLFCLAGCGERVEREITLHESALASATSQVALGATVEPNRAPVVIAGELNEVDWKSLIGQNVTIKGNLTIVDTYDLVRRGQVKVARDRLYVPTSQIDPNDKNPNATSFQGGNNVAKVVEAQKFNDSATIIIDDGSAKQNIFPPLLFPNLGKKDPTVRIGSTVRGVSGRLVKAGPVILLVPNRPLRWKLAKRPKRPDVGRANVTVASFNVLNYFSTIDNKKNHARGADSEAELKRQEDKLVAAIIALESDVIGLMELENNLESESRLVAALNRKLGKEVFKGCGLPKGFADAPGGRDDIRVGIIYRSDRVSPKGDVMMMLDQAFMGARTPIAQTFKPKAAGRPFSLVVNHFKSKGGADKAEVANKNKGDGQGAFNAKRRSQALALCKQIDKLRQGNKLPRVLIVGDLNAYEQEDPIDALRAFGLVDLHEQAAGKRQSDEREKYYSYNYRGQSGSLDHAFATPSLAGDVTGVEVWHINADEPRSLDYNQEFNPKELYEADPFRSSDHDPVLIGIKK